MTSQQQETYVPLLRKAIAKRMSSVKVTQGMLAKAVGMSQGNLSRYLKNKGNISSAKIDTILDLLAFHTSYGDTFRWDSNDENCVHCRVKYVATYKKMFEF